MSHGHKGKAQSLGQEALHPPAALRCSTGGTPGPAPPAVEGPPRHLPRWLTNPTGSCREKGRDNALNETWTKTITGRPCFLL